MHSPKYCNHYNENPGQRSTLLRPQGDQVTIGDQPLRTGAFRELTGLVFLLMLSFPHASLGF